MKFVILVHSSPQPWGHPTGDYVAENQQLQQEQRDQMNTEFEALLSEIQRDGELVTAEALADPRSSSIYRWEAGTPIATDGPYAETKEQFAGFFLIDVTDRERADAIAAKFAGPGETIELRPAMWPHGDDQ